MLYNFLLNFVDLFSFLNVFKYITFRTGLAVFTSLVIVLLIGSPFIKFFANKAITNPIRDDGPSDHIIKKIGTPTMGGLIILTGLLISVLMWGDLKNVYVIFALYIAISFGLLGAYDDYQKIKFKNSSGISSKIKIIIQIILAVIGLLFLIESKKCSTSDCHEISVGNLTCSSSSHVAAGAEVPLPAAVGIVPLQAAEQPYW